MAIDQNVWEVLEEQKTLVLNLDHSKVTEAAKEIAFYTAMLDAALEDPMEDPEEQTEILAYFKANLSELTNTYQTLVNDHLT